MRKNDAQIGKPSILYKDAKSNIEALSGIESGATAYATGTKELGCYDGTQWVWVSPSDIDNFDVQGGTGTLVFPSSGATLTINGNSSVNGANTGDQTITLTGDVTGSGIGSFLATIANKAVTLAKMADMATASFLGRNSSGSGTPEVLSIATAKSMLNLSGTNTGDQTISLTGDVSGSGTGAITATIANKAVTLAKMADMATASFLGRNSAGSGAPEVLSKAIAKAMLDLSGKNTGDQAGYGFTPLTAPLTSTNWDGDSYSTTSKTLIDLSSVFGAPNGIKAVLFRTGVRDSASATNDCYLILSPNSTNNQGMFVRCSGVANDKYVNSSIVVPCNADGDVYYQIKASGTDTLRAHLEIWGYWY